MSSSERCRFIVSYSPDLKLDGRGIYTDGCTLALHPCINAPSGSGNRVPYDITFLGDHELVEMPGEYAGAFCPRFTKLASDGTLLEACNGGAHVTLKLYSCIKQCTLLWSSTVPGRIYSCDDMLHTRLHIAFVNKSPHARFAGVCFFKVDPLKRASQDPRVSMGHFNTGSSARLHWGDEGKRTLVITVPESKAVMCVNLGQALRPELACPFVVVPNIDLHNHDQMVLAAEMAGTFERAHGISQILGAELSEPSYAKHVSDETCAVVRLSVQCLSQFLLESCESIHYAADGGYMYSISNHGTEYHISKFRLPRYGVTDVGVTPTTMHILKGPPGLPWFLDLKRTQIKHLGTAGSAVLFVVQGRAGGLQYVSYLWFNSVDEVQEYTYRDGRAAEMLPTKLVRCANSTPGAVTIMTDKGSFIVRFTQSSSKRGFH